MSAGPLQAGLESQGSNILASQNCKHHRVEEVLQRQALSKSSPGRSLENMVIIRPLRLQEDYSPGERIFGGFRLPLPQMRIKEHLRVLEGALGAPSPPEPWQAHSFLAPIPHYPPTPTPGQLGVPRVS